MADAAPASESGSRKKWLIPVGCLGAIVLCCGLPVSIGLVVFGAIKSSIPYQESLARVQASPEVQQLLGEPIEPAFIVEGNIEVNGPEGHAGLSYNITGPKGPATVVVDADKVGGEWTFNILKVQSPEDVTINLLPDDAVLSNEVDVPESAPVDE